MVTGIKPTQARRIPAAGFVFIEGLGAVRGWARRFYRSAEWMAKRQEILRRDNHECQQCKRDGKFSPANTVHHIEHLIDRPDLALEADNLESLCPGCHNREHPEKFFQPSESARSRRFPERW